MARRKTRETSGQYATPSKIIEKIRIPGNPNLAGVIGQQGNSYSTWVYDEKTGKSHDLHSFGSNKEKAERDFRAIIG